MLVWEVLSMWLSGWKSVHTSPWARCPAEWRLLTLAARVAR